MKNIKENLKSSLGILGTILYLVLSAALLIAPLIYIGLPVWANFLILMCIACIPFIGDILRFFIMAWALIVIVGKPLTFGIIVCYTSLAFYAFYLIGIILNIVATYIEKKQCANVSPIMSESSTSSEIDFSILPEPEIEPSDTILNDSEAKKTAIANRFIEYKKQKQNEEIESSIGKINPYTGKIIQTTEDYMQYMNSFYEEGYQKYKGQINPATDEEIKTIDDFITYLDFARFGSFMQENPDLFDNNDVNTNVEESEAKPDYELGKILDEVGAPYGVRIDKNGYPIQYIGGIDVYRVKAFKHDIYYHRPDCPRANSNHYEIYNFAYLWMKADFGHKPCPYCHPRFPDLSWFYRYVEKTKTFDPLGFLKG